MATKNQQNVDEAMGNTVLNSAKLLGAIKIMLHDLPAPESKDLNWGHVGTARAIEEHLSEAYQMLADATGRTMRLKGGVA